MKVLTETDSHYSGILHGRCGGNAVIRLMNGFIYSDLFYLFIAAVCALAFTFRLEAPVYTVYALLVIFIALFGQSIDRILAVIPFYYIAPGVTSNPAVFETSNLLKPSNVIYIGILAAVQIIFIAILTVRAARRGHSGKPKLLWGYLLLGAAYICSGLFSTGASFKNSCFGFVEFLSIFAFYIAGFFIINSKTCDIASFAKLGCAMGLTLLIEMLDIYMFSGVFAGDHINRGSIFTGWGMYNNVGNMICFCIPCAFYMMYRSERRKTAWFLYASLLLAAVFLTTSRGSILTGAVVFLLSIILVTSKHPDRRRIFTRIAIAVGIMIFAAVGIGVYVWMRYDVIRVTLDKVLEYGVLNDSGRFEAWQDGLSQFREYPIFGKGFYECTAFLYFGGVGDLLPARWHNTLVQLLASCGIFGLLAYLFHRVQTVWMIFKNRIVEGYFIGLSILAILLGTLTDNHFFNLGPGLIYGMFLAFAETNKNEIKQIT